MYVHELLNVLHLHCMSDNANHCELSTAVFVPFVFFVLFILVICEVWLYFSRAWGNLACYGTVLAGIHMGLSARAVGGSVPRTEF